MKPVVLLVGRLPAVVENVARELEDLPVQWLGAHNRDEVVRQLESEPGIATVVMGAGLDDRLRGDIIGVIAGLRPDLCIHVKDRISGSAGMAPFARRVILSELLGEYA